MAENKGETLIAYNCEICGGKTYCKSNEPYACANNCKPQVEEYKPSKPRKKKDDASPTTEPDTLSEDDLAAEHSAAEPADA